MTAVDWIRYFSQNFVFLNASFDFQVKNDGIPYGDSFSVHYRYCITRTSSMASRLRYNSIALHFVSRIFIIRSLVKWCFNLINNNHCYMEFIESCVCLCMTSLWILLNNIDCVTRSDRMIGGVMPWTHPTHIKVSFRLAAAQMYTCFSSSLINLSVTYCSALEEKRKKHWFMSENCSSVCMTFAQVCDVKWSADM